MAVKRAPTVPRTIDDFVGKFFVACPECSKMATVTSSSRFGPVRLACEQCGFTKSKSVRSYSLGSAEDPYFGLPLWLQAPCSPHTLWAYNLDHLSCLKEYVEATDRRRPVRNPVDPLNKLLASRLPKWMQSSKNRDQVLKAIAKIEAKLLRPANTGMQPTAQKTRRG
jgi:hypothetical protein